MSDPSIWISIRSASGEMSQWHQKIGDNKKKTKSITCHGNISNLSIGPSSKEEIAVLWLPDCAHQVEEWRLEMKDLPLSLIF
jgi:hypothetical protein